MSITDPSELHYINTHFSLSPNSEISNWSAGTDL